MAYEDDYHKDDAHAPTIIFYTFMVYAVSLLQLPVKQTGLSVPCPTCKDRNVV